MKEFDDIDLIFRNSEFNSISNEFLHDSEFNPIKIEIDDGKEFSNESDSKQNSQSNNETNTTNSINTSKTTSTSDLSSAERELVGKSSVIAMSTSMGTAVSALALCVASVGIGAYSDNSSMNISQVESQYEEFFEQPQVLDNNLPPITPNNEVVNDKEEVKTENKQEVKKEQKKDIKGVENKPEQVKKFEVSVSSYDGVYDGKEHSGDIENLPDGAIIKYGKSVDKIDLDKVPEYKDAGEYTVYYKVSKEGYEPYVGNFKIRINKKIVDPPDPLIEETTYNGEMQTPKFIDDGGFEYFGTMSAMNAGTYEIKIKLNDSKNYEWSDGNNDEKIVSWVIKPREVTIEWNGKEDYKYDGNKHSIDATIGNIAPGDFLDFTVEGNSATEPGEYIAQITSINGSKNYVLPKKNSFTWAISK